MTDPRGGEGTPLIFSLAAGSVAALNVVGVGGLVYTFATSFWKEKGAALMGWLCGLAPTKCCRGKTRRDRRESTVELLPESEYAVMDDDGE